MNKHNYTSTNHLINDITNSSKEDISSIIDMLIGTSEKNYFSKKN